jgi:hypothetical protein
MLAVGLVDGDGDSIAASTGVTLRRRDPGGDVIILKIFSPKNSAKKLAFLTQNKAKLCKILILILFFDKTPIFSPKIAEYCDHNIDPWRRCYYNKLRRISPTLAKNMAFFLKTNVVI